MGEIDQALRATPIDYAANHFSLCPRSGVYSAGTHATAGQDPLNDTPTFNPGLAASSGLQLLAAAATTAQGKAKLPLAPATAIPLLRAPGPYNPAASLPPKIVKKLLELEFVEMSELTINDTTPQVPGRAPPPARPPITNVSHWVERFALMAAVICSRFPEKSPELFAYLGTIVRAERNYDGQRWVTYDRQYRREALARKDLNWSVTDSRLYSEAFTGRARAIARCTYCLQDDHTDAYCTSNPNRAMLNYYPAPVMWPTPAAWPTMASLPGTSAKSSEICRRFNEGRCRHPRCRYRHSCSWCQAAHPAVQCPLQAGQQPHGRSRSPPRPLGKATPPSTGPR